MRRLLRLAAASLAAALVLAAALALIPARDAGAAEPAHPRPLRVVASIKPLHSLIAGVMSGRGAPTLLIPEGASPYSSPVHANEAYLLSGADVVFWVGEPLEAGLKEPLARFAASARVVDLLRVAGLVRYRTRNGGYWEPGTAGPGTEVVLPDTALMMGWYGTGGQAPADNGSSYYGGPATEATALAGDDEDGAEGGEGDAEAEGEAEPPVDLTGVDGHVWLDPLNAQLMVDRIVEVLSEADIENAPDYRRNGESVKSRLEKLDADLAAILAPVHGKPFLVVHDAYQYLEVRYALAGSGSLKLPLDHPPSEERLAEVQAKVKAREAQCVFGDPRLPRGVAERVVAGTQARAGELDPLGAGLPDGIDLYFMMMRRLATSLEDCLAG